MIVLGIETSCDETASAICRDGEILSSFTWVQSIHKQFGGVVAARHGTGTGGVREAKSRGRAGLRPDPGAPDLQRALVPDASGRAQRVEARGGLPQSLEAVRPSSRRTQDLLAETRSSRTA